MTTTLAHPVARRRAATAQELLDAVARPAGSYAVLDDDQRASILARDAEVVTGDLARLLHVARRRLAAAPQPRATAASRSTGSDDRPGTETTTSSRDRCRATSSGHARTLRLALAEPVVNVGGRYSCTCEPGTAELR